MPSALLKCKPGHHCFVNLEYYFNGLGLLSHAQRPILVALIDNKFKLLTSYYPSYWRYRLYVYWGNNVNPTS
jgi:hypothetical protein